MKREARKKCSTVLLVSKEGVFWADIKRPLRQEAGRQGRFQTVRSS